MTNAAQNSHMLVDRIPMILIASSCIAYLIGAFYFIGSRHADGRSIIWEGPSDMDFPNYQYNWDLLALSTTKSCLSTAFNASSIHAFVEGLRACSADEVSPTQRVSCHIYKEYGQEEWNAGLCTGHHIRLELSTAILCAEVSLLDTQGDPLSTESFYAPMVLLCPDSSDVNCPYAQRRLLLDDFMEVERTPTPGIALMLSNLHLFEEHRSYWSVFSDGTTDYILIPWVVTSSFGRLFFTKEILSGTIRSSLHHMDGEAYIKDNYDTMVTRSFMFPTKSILPILQVVVYLAMIVYTCHGRTGELPVLALQWNTAAFTVVSLFLFFNTMENVEQLTTGLYLRRLDQSGYFSLLCTSTLALVLGFFCIVLYIRRMILGAVFSLEYMRSGMVLAVVGSVTIVASIFYLYAHAAEDITTSTDCENGANFCYNVENDLFLEIYGVVLVACCVLNRGQDVEKILEVDPRRGENNGIPEADKDPKNLTTFERYCIGSKAFWNCPYIPDNIVVDGKELVPIEVVLNMGFLPLNGGRLIRQKDLVFYWLERVTPKILLKHFYLTRTQWRLSPEGTSVENMVHKRFLCNDGIPRFPHMIHIPGIGGKFHDDKDDNQI